MSRRPAQSRTQSGISYVEVMLATTLIMIALTPMMDALSAGLQGSRQHKDMSYDRFALTQKMETVLAQPFTSLLNAAATGNSKDVPTAYSDTAGSKGRRLVYLSFYDLADTDGDTNPFTIADTNTDGDNNPYTGNGADIKVVWIRVRQEHGMAAVESLAGLQ